jgi:hypothetical protein
MHRHIFMIDLDGTIIGDISPQVILWDLSNKSKGLIKYNPAQLKFALSSNLVRPHFVDFFKYLKSVDALVYVYTASEKRWANFVIPHLERACGIRFDRPIFTRKDCKLREKEFSKSLQFISRPLMSSLKKNHPDIFQHGKVDVLKSVTIIDNTNVYHPSDQPQLVMCPTYSYKYPENIASQISYDQFKANEQLIHDFMSRCIPDYRPSSDFWTFQKRMAQHFINMINSNTRGGENDSFFTILLSFMKMHPKHYHAKYINRYIVSKR